MSVVEGDAQALVFDLSPRPLAGGQLRDLAAPALGLGIELETVGADIGGAPELHDASGVLPGAAAHEREQAVAVAETLQFGTRLLRHARIFRTRNDRRQRPVHVEDDA